MSHGYVDVHCHIVYRVDDGSKSLDMTLKMVDMAYESGTRIMIATPHYEIGRYENNNEKIKSRFNEIKAAAEKKYPDFKVFLGHEVMYTYGIPDRLERGEINTMAGSKYVLIEFGYEDAVSFIKEAVEEVIGYGYIPIIAHVERYANVMKKLDNVGELIKKGALIQVNTSTVAGKYGRGMRRKVLKLIKNDMVHFLGTDAHNDTNRNPDIGGCLEVLKKKVDEEKINEIFRDNALKVINGETID